MAANDDCLIHPERLISLCVLILSSGLTLAGCAHEQVEPSNLSVMVRPNADTIRTGLVEVLVVNRSGDERCVREDILQRPGSAATQTLLRHDGRRIAWMPDGYLIPELGEPRVIPPGGEVSFNVDVRGRHDITSYEKRRGRWDIRVGVSNYPCSTPVVGAAKTEWSDWTRLVPEGSTFPSAPS